MFQVCIKFSSSERITENTMLHLYFNEESHYSEENTCKNEVFNSTILHQTKKLNYLRLSCRCISYNCQKQPLEVLCEKKCSEKLCKINRKTFVSESLF